MILGVPLMVIAKFLVVTLLCVFMMIGIILVVYFGSSKDKG
jgi:hypothetical protein